MDTRFADGTTQRSWLRLDNPWMWGALAVIATGFATSWLWNRWDRAFTARSLRGRR